MEKLKVKEPPYHIFFLFLSCLICLFLIQPYLFEEILNSFFASNNSVVFSSKILRRNSTLDIGILIVVVDEKSDLNEYQQALASVECYAQIQGYGFHIERINDQWRSECGNINPNFLRHCIASKLLKLHEWTLFLAPEIGIVNPHRLIEKFIFQDVEIIFYDKINNWEISSDSYLARNSTFAEQFLMRFSLLEHLMPPVLLDNIHGRDIEAIHWLFLQEFYLNFSTSNFSPSDCWSIWSASKTFDDLKVFVACCRQIFGERHLFCNEEDYCIELLPKREAWIRDGTITESKFSLINDFMFYGWKESYRIPMIEKSNSWTRASRRLLYSSWYSPLAEMVFDKKACSNGKILWKWYQSFLISDVKLDKLLEDVQSKAQEDFLKISHLIPNYL